MNTQTKLINYVLLLELWEAYFVLESGYQESLGMLFGGIPPHREVSDTSIFHVNNIQLYWKNEQRLFFL